MQLRPAPLPFVVACGDAASITVAATAVSPDAPSAVEPEDSATTLLELVVG